MERVLEERLRERVCLGDTEAVQDLLTLGVDVNAREPVSGWYLSFQFCFQKQNPKKYIYIFLNFFLILYNSFSLVLIKWNNLHSIAYDKNGL